MIWVTFDQKERFTLLLFDLMDSLLWTFNWDLNLMSELLTDFSGTNSRQKLWSCLVFHIIGLNCFRDNAFAYGLSLFFHRNWFFVLGQLGKTLTLFTLFRLKLRRQVISLPMVSKNGLVFWENMLCLWRIIPSLNLEGKTHCLHSYFINLSEPL